MSRKDQTQSHHRARAASQITAARRNLRTASHVSGELRSAALAEVLSAALDVYRLGDVAHDRLERAAKTLIAEPEIR